MSVQIFNFPQRPLTLSLTLLIITILTSACATPVLHAPGTTSVAPSVDAHSSSDGDRIEISRPTTPDRNQLTIDVYSERGIGSATFTFAHYFPDHLPAQVILNLHLNGLEQLQITTDDQVISANIPASGNGNSMQSAASASNDTTQVQSISANNPLWLTITKTDGADGYFSIVLPSLLFTKDVQNMTLKWVDFYR